MFLRCAVQDSPATWKSWLSLAELWYNSTYHASLGCSPFKALYGYEPNIGATPTVSTNTPTIQHCGEQRIAYAINQATFGQCSEQNETQLTEIELISSSKSVIKFALSYSPILSLQWLTCHFPS